MRLKILSLQFESDALSREGEYRWQDKALLETCSLLRPASSSRDWDSSFKAGLA
jgi:hypothetical protein